MGEDRPQIVFGAGFRPFFNPATGEWITYTAVAEDTFWHFRHGSRVTYRWDSRGIPQEPRRRNHGSELPRAGASPPR